MVEDVTFEDGFADNVDAEEAAEALRDQQPPAAPQFDGRVPCGKQTAQQLHLGDAVLAETFGLELLLDKLDSGIEL